jgi:hypothetical protein
MRMPGGFTFSLHTGCRQNMSANAPIKKPNGKKYDDFCPQHIEQLKGVIPPVLRSDHRMRIGHGLTPSERLKSFANNMAQSRVQATFYDTCMSMNSSITILAVY